MLNLQDDVVATRDANVIPDKTILKLSTIFVKVDSVEELQRIQESQYRLVT